MNINLEYAINFAKDSHEGQFRRDGVTPYWKHLEAVASRVETEDEKIVAWLHDTIEDCECNHLDLLDAGFPKHIVVAVDLLSKPPGCVYMDYLKKLKSNNLARKVKIADIIHNLSDDPNKTEIRKYAKGLLLLTDSKEYKRRV